MAISYFEEQQIFYYEIGLTITQWASVEHSFQNAYVASFGKFNHATSATFYSIENFRSKLSAADAAFHWNLKVELKPTWASIYKKLRKRSQARNALAHRYILSRPDNKPGKRLLLVENVSRPAPDERPEKEAFGVRDIVLLRYGFYGLSNELSSFAAEIQGFSMPPLASRAQLERPPTLETLLAQMREDASPPHRPLRG
jgi:hypothetical protein